MGGFVLPFMERLGEDVAPWDFRISGVTSISLDDWLGGFYASPNMQGSRAGNTEVVDHFLTDLQAAVTTAQGSRAADRSTNYSTLN